MALNDTLSSSSPQLAVIMSPWSSCKDSPAIWRQSGSEVADSSLAQRRLTRQRRLRYVTDHDIGIGHVNERSQSSPASPESAQKLRWSPPGREHWSFSSVPQPLPLPDALYVQKVSPPPGSCWKDAEQTAVNQVKTASKRWHSNRLSHDANAGQSFAGFPSSPTIRSSAGDIMLLSRNHPNSSGHVSKAWEAPNLRVSVPSSRSAPTSPRRSSPAEVLWFFAAPPDFPDPRSAGNSPPRRAVPRSWKPSKAVTFPLRHKSQSEAVPLPLPPGANCSAPAGGEGPCLSSPSSMKGQWQKGKLIGRGTFGSVYLGTNKETGALCAMKEVDLIPDDPKSTECIKQLEQEIRVLRQLKHPNIVQYYGSEVVDDHFYIYLEYVYPGSINKYVREHCGGAMTESVVRNFTRHILSGLAYLHATKTIHRDIKGANLLVNASGVVKLADFGMAKHLTGHSYDLSLKGSPYWMAPEVIKAAMQNNGSSYLALAVDIWSLGCTIIEMFNGKPPWSELTPPQAMFKVLNRAPPIPENLSSEGKDFLKCCFQRNPADRPSAAKLLKHAFVCNLHSQSVSPTTQSSYLVHIMERLQVHRDRSKDKFDFFVIANTSPTYCGNASSPVTLSM